MADMILRLPAVKARTGLSRSSIYLRVAEGKFPKPISLGARAVGWVDSEVNAWVADQIELSRRTQGKPFQLEERW
jgi:prophage regulatory protein